MGSGDKILGLYAIIDSAYVRPEKVKETASALLSAGVKIIQLRAKDWEASEILKAAKLIKEAALQSGAIFILNDRIDLALLSKADGVHLGQDDIPIKDARRLLGEGSIIGISTHNPEEAVLAESNGADYISFGPIFKTTTKKDAQSPKGLEALSQIRACSRSPIVAIGGIKEDKAAGVMEAGADSVAIISDILLAGDISKKTASVIGLLKNSSKERKPV